MAHEGARREAAELGRPDVVNVAMSFPQSQREPAVDICYLGPDRSPVSLEIPELDEDGVCFMGRQLIKREGKDDENKDSTRLVLAEPVVDVVVPRSVPWTLKTSLRSPRGCSVLKDNDDLAVILTKLLKLPNPPNKQKIMSPSVTGGNGN